MNPATTSTRILAILLLLCATAHADILQESGSLRAFMAGSEPGTAYDNWISHVSEGIARPGYNAYAPEWLDPQTNGFGSFEVLENEARRDSVLGTFRELAPLLLQGLAAEAETLLQEGPFMAYELVAFDDSESGRLYYILRERLNTDYVDPGLSPQLADDVIGSFDHGWGIYVFQPLAERPRAIVQAPHPCDDYPSPYTALALFQRLDAGVLMINGAGREVAHNASGAYSNNSSLSDPSRNCEHPFQAVHESLVDFWQDLGQDELVIQMHTYDDASHRDLKSLVVVGGRNNRIHNPPLFDPGGGRKGLLGNLGQPVFAADALGWPHAEWPLQEYMASNALYPVYVDGGIPDSLIRIPTSASLWGHPGSCQFNYIYPESGEDYPECNGVERALHVEIDELPTPAHEEGFDAFYALGDTSVAVWEHFVHHLAFSQPFFESLVEAHDSLGVFEDLEGPTTPEDLALRGFTASSLRIGWTPSRSTWFGSYEVLIDTGSVIGPTPEVRDLEVHEELCWPGTRLVWIDGLELGQVYTLALRARDSQGRSSDLSNAVSGMPDDLDPPEIVVPRQPAAFGGTPPTLLARIQDETGVSLAQLEWSLDEVEWASYVMELSGGTLYTAELPALEAGMTVYYRVLATDQSGNDNSAQSPVYSLTVLQDLMALDFEEPGDLWHEAIGTAIDQWHRSTEDSWDGATSWKFGDTGAGNYADDAGGWLYTPQWVVPVGAVEPALQVLLRVDAEASASQPDSCYDGLVIQQRLEEGEWDTCELLPGWTHFLRGGSDVVLDWPQAMLSGSQDWQPWTLSLPEDTRRLQLRFGFVSDGSVNAEGIYLDALRLGAQIPENPATATELRLSLLPGHRLELSWLPVWQAEGYRLYHSAEAYGGPGEIFHETTDTELLLDLDCCTEQQFYRVEALLPPARILRPAAGPRQRNRDTSASWKP